MYAAAFRANEETTEGSNWTNPNPQRQVALGESEAEAYKLLVKLERILKSFKDLLKQLPEASKDEEA